MKNVSHKNNCNRGSVEAHIDQLQIMFIKSNNNEKSDKDCVKIILRR